MTDGMPPTPAPSAADDQGMTDGVSRGGWRPRQWALWLIATAVSVVAIGYPCVVFVYFGIECSGSQPLPASVRTVQIGLALAVVLGVAGWWAAAWFLGRWWLRAAISAALTVAWPAVFLLAHLSTGSWAGFGMCDM